MGVFYVEPAVYVAVESENLLRQFEWDSFGARIGDRSLLLSVELRSPSYPNRLQLIFHMLPTPIHILLDLCKDGKYCGIADASNGFTSQLVVPRENSCPLGPSVLR